MKALNRRVVAPTLVSGTVAAVLGATLVGLFPGRAAGDVSATSSLSSAASPASAATPPATPVPPMPVEQLCKAPAPKPAAPKCAR
jgi:hypothetical protein